MNSRCLFALSLASLLLIAATAQAAGPPSVPAAWVTDVTATSANLRATIEPNGLPTTYRFEYLTETAYEQGGWAGASLLPLSGKAPYGSSPGVPAFQHLEHLTPATTYRYRAVATNSAGTGPSPEHLLSTEAIPLAPAPCPNDPFRLGAGSDLPDCRAYELLSPPGRGSASISAPEATFGGGQLQASPAGPAAITYGSAASFGPAPGAPPVSQYISRRGAGGWDTENISAPLAGGAYGDHPDGAPYRLFSTDLGSALLFGGLPCLTTTPGCPFPNPVLPGSGAPTGYMAYYLRDSAGAFTSLLDSADLAQTSVDPEAFSVRFLAATPDLAHIVLSSCAKLTPDANETAGCAGQNLYEWDGGTLKAINLLHGHSETTPGAALAAPVGAVSGDGDRAYMYQLEDGPIYLREGVESKEIAGTIGEPASFQVASDNGRYAFYTKKSHLYRWDAESEVSTDLTPAGGVKGVLAACADGSTVYYQDATGLQRWREGAATEIAAGPDVALPSDYPPASATARISPDGLHLAFLSAAEIPPFDNLDAETETPDTELYLYGPPPGGGTPELICASCNPTGERPRGSASIPGTPHNGSTAAYRPRALSADGRRLFFDSDDRLVIADTDGARDVYQWQAQGSGDCARSPGCVSLISGGRSDSAQFIDASADGSDVYFLTGASLLESDPGSGDIYDARIEGGFPEALQPIPCKGDACQALPNPPDDPSPGTAVPNSGNPPVKYYKPPKKHHKRHHRKRHVHRSGR